MARFLEPTNDTTQISSAAISILNRIFIPDVAFKRACVWLSEIIPFKSLTPSLFDSQEAIQEKLSRTHLMKVVDKINLGPNFPILKLASQITQGHPGHNDGYSSSFQAPKN